MIDKDKTISKGMTLKLEKILDLQSKESLEKAWDALPGIINQMVTFEKALIKAAQGYAAGAGVKFARETWTKEWKPGDKVESPLSLIANAFRGKEFSKVCTDQSLSSHKEKFFNDECDREIVLGDKKAKVVDVLKSAYDNSGSWSWSEDWKVATKDRVGGWAGQNQLSDSSAKSDLYYKGFHKGLIAEQCPQLGPSIAIWDMANDLANKTVCNKILQGVFQNDVSDKRYCLYQIPGIKGYLRK
ncbi:hypothetical protein MHLP_03495 [Candidatus Mycoplasma haematolamae str. Purdue]|uniref:Uncharacterized protein n=1 Tax=Mycoplasma haematolamae (strain Purdue) TaxID=1212765 RepID=I7CK66_MYCHA|nr:hypothetical protein [Candidatus Mycoplasma haematolamae]AFO52279.1 hypothetical protein MHLP_03495 [Candidatus Mycoplasma haematolamae str. Purdue]